MGSFPNKTAGNILKMLFNSTATVAAPCMYGTTTSTAGILTEQTTAGSTNLALYIGLIEGGTASLPINESTANLGNIVNDTVITATGTSAPFASTTGVGTYALKEYTRTSGGYGAIRKAITFGTVADDGDAPAANTLAKVQGPSATVTFASAATGVTTGQTDGTAVIGFFISTYSSGGNASATLPTIVAYGHLSSARRVLQNDNPTFAANAITITLD